MRTGKRILVVDDLTAAADSIARILENSNYTNVDCQYGAAGALSALRQEKYELVITDTQMEPIGGAQLAKLIRADGLKVKIIVIGPPVGSDQEWLNWADGYVIKPFEPRDIEEKVAEVLSTVAQLASG